MNFIGRYINQQGKLITVLCKLTHNIQSPHTKEIAIDKVLKPIQQGIMLIRDESDVDVNNNFTVVDLKTSEFEIKMGLPNLKYINLPVPSFGGIVECLNMNLSMMTQLEQQNQYDYHEGVQFRLVPFDKSVDHVYFVMNKIGELGITSNIFKASFTFTTDWTSTCHECNEYNQTLQSELEKLSNELFADKVVPFIIKGNVIQDFTYSSVNDLESQLNILFKNTMERARIEKINIEEVTNILIDYENV